LTSGHKSVIAKANANATAERNGLFDAMASSITLAIALYRVILVEVFRKSGLPESEWITLRGGEYYGLVTGKDGHTFHYSGAAEDYPSQSYLTNAFTLQYMHTDERLKEYRSTNSNPQVKTYCQWLSIMFGAKYGTHCTLQRAADKTLAKWTLTPANATDKAKGKSYHSAVLKSEVRDNANTVATPKAIADAISEVKSAAPSKRRTYAAEFDTSTWSQTALAECIRSMVAQYMLNAEVAKAAKGKPKVKASK